MMDSPKRRVRRTRKAYSGSASQTDIKIASNNLYELLLIYPKPFWEDIALLVKSNSKTPTIWDVKPISQRHRVKWSHANHAAHIVWLKIHGKSLKPSPMPMPKSLAEALEVLELKHPCSLQEAKNAYKKRIRLVHPDQGGNQDEAKAVNRTWELVRNYLEAYSVIQKGGMV